MLNLSDPADAHRNERLKSDLILWLSSVRPDGRPHLVPVWYLWDDGTVLVFSQPNSQKLRNLRQNNRVTAALDDTFEGDDAISFEGTAELVNDPAVSVLLPGYVGKYASQLVEMGTSPEAMAADFSQAIRISPTRFF